MPTKRTLRRKLTKRQHHHCLACGKRAVLTLDHVKPKALGGTTIMQNLQGLCYSCNTKKGDKFIDYRGA